MRYFIAIVFLILFFYYSEIVLFSLKGYRKDSKNNKLDFYNDLIEKLEDVDTKKNLQKLFLDKRVTFLSNLILLNLDQPSIKKHVMNSLKSKALKKGRRFLRKYKKVLLKAQKVYSIPKEIIVAILYIETKFNLKVAKYYTFNAYTSLFYANHPKYLNLNLSKLKKKYKNLAKKEFDAKIKLFRERSIRKSNWALKQVKALFQVAKSMRKHILNLKGSFAGAMGYPQFIPTSYISYAVDGNCDYIIDLYNIKDAIFSVANYLRMQGFKKNNLKSQRKAIYHYNNNDDYVYFILNYSKKL